MTNLIKNFANDESGAVTVDWVVLTAAAAAMAIAAGSAISGSTGTLTTNTTTAVGAYNPFN